jgi:GAF domain-containing protein
VLNAQPAIDLGAGVTALSPPLRSSLTVPLSHQGVMTGVLSLYASGSEAFTDDHARLISLLAPSLASSIAALPKADAWTQAAEPRRSIGGELRLLKR